MLKVLIFVVSLMGAGVGVYAVVTMLGLMRRRVERETAGPGPTPDELDTIHARLAAAEALEPRVQDLEERLDFAERLLAQQHEPEALPRPERH